MRYEFTEFYVDCSSAILASLFLMVVIAQQYLTF